LALAFASFAHGQAVFSGGEFRVVEPLTGDQTFPALAIGPAGGWVIWQDNASDGPGKGLGLRAQRLASDFTRVGSPLRVNTILPDDQERPRASLLKDGGAVFVWQGGKRTARRIYARFATAGGVLTGNDLRVNTYNRSIQADPAVATLADGNVIVVWASYEQDGSLWGVYGQRLSPRGARLGPEFRLTQVTAGNQRNPVVAALADGGFIVAWVAELQRGAASVDIYARRFSADATPVGDEFPVNADATRPAATPAVAALDDGRFAIAWCVKDVQPVNQAGFLQSVNPGGTGWDIAARVFAPDASPATEAFRVNSHTFGDQYLPSLCALGDGFLAVWTSLGQDGSWEGVFGQLFRPDGVAVDGELRLNTTVLSRQLHPVAAGDGQGRALVVWSSFGFNTSFDLFGRVLEGPQSTVVTTGAGATLQWFTRPGAVYQPQASADAGATWTSHGPERPGSGSPDTLGIVEDKNIQYRVIRAR
jgi:hypothetical protein